MTTHILSPQDFHILLSVALDPADCELILTRIAYDTLGDLELEPDELADRLQDTSDRGWLKHDQEAYPAVWYLDGAGRDVLLNDLYRWRIVTSRATQALRQTVSGNALGSGSI